MHDLAVTVAPIEFISRSMILQNLCTIPASMIKPFPIDTQLLADSCQRSCLCRNINLALCGHGAGYTALNKQVGGFGLAQIDARE